MNINEYNPFKTALKRTSLSKPMVMLLKKKLISPDAKMLDFGCGYGRDVKELSAYPFNYNIQGYDAYSPLYKNSSCLLNDKYDIITCNYVFNVIADLDTHRKTLDTLLSICRVAYITVRSDEKAIKDSWEYSEAHRGYWTSSTFQRFYDEDMVRELFGDVEFIVSNSSMKLFKIRGKLE